MTSKFMLTVPMMTLSIASGVQADSVSNLVYLKNTPPSVYLLVVGICAFVFLRKAVSAGKESGVNISQPLPSKLHINQNHKSIT